MTDTLVERLADALENSFKVAIEQSSGKSFADSGVMLPARSIWLRYAEAASALGASEPVAWTSRANLQELSNPGIFHAVMVPKNTANMNVPLYVSPPASPVVTEAMEAGCCSAMTPCRHQQVNPHTICETCKLAALSTPPAPVVPDPVTVARRVPVRVPEGQTPLNDRLHHPLLDAFNAGSSARETGASSPYHGHSLEHCLHAAGWVQRDLRLALDAAKAAPSQGEQASRPDAKEPTSDA